MLRRITVRFCALMLAVTLGVGLPLNGAMAGAMSGESVAAMGADKAMPEGCDRCWNAGDAASDTCSAICVGTGPATLPAIALFAPSRPKAFAATAPLDGSGRSGPPDPYPPKQSGHD